MDAAAVDHGKKVPNDSRFPPPEQDSYGGRVGTGNVFNISHYIKLGPLVRASADRMRWSVKGKAALFDTLGLTAAQRAAFMKIFKMPIVELSGVASNVSP